MDEGIFPISKRAKIAENSGLELIKERISGERKYVHGVCYKIMGKKENTDAIDEVTNEIIYKAIRNVAQFKDTGEKGSLQAWLAGISRNTIVDYLRKTNRDPINKKAINIDDLFIKYEGKSPEERTITNEKKRAVREAIKLLPEKYQEVLNMELEGLTHPEIIKSLGLPEGTVKSNLRKAKIELTKILGEKKDFLI